MNVHALRFCLPVLALRLMIPGVVLARQSPSLPSGGGTDGPVPLTVVSVDLENAKLENVAVLGWFKPSKKDTDSIKEALVVKLAKYASKSPADQERSLKIWVVVRRYLYVTTSGSSRALVAVAWTAAYDADRIIFHEEFYASKFRIGWSTKGPVKDAIASRIAETAIQLAGMREGDALRPVAVENTFLSFDKANEHIGLQEVVVPGSVKTFGNGYSYYYTLQNWSWAEHPAQIDWPAYIATQPTGVQPKTSK